MLILFSFVFGTLCAALGKVSTACPARCVSEGLLNGQQLVRVGTNSDSFRDDAPCPPFTGRLFGCSVVNCSELREGRGIAEGVRFSCSPCQVLQETC
jgi:hypothetical protein